MEVITNERQKIFSLEFFPLFLIPVFFVSLVYRLGLYPFFDFFREREAEATSESEEEWLPSEIKELERKHLPSYSLSTFSF